MKPENAEKYFVKYMTYWTKRLKVPLTEIFRDNRYWISANVEIYYNKRYCTYNSKHLANWRTKKALYHVIFHEIGHLKNYMPYKTYKQKMKSEYIAEKAALKMLKKYYPKYYKKRLKELPEDLKGTLTYPKEKRYYYEAFKQIKEYQGTPR